LQVRNGKKHSRGEHVYGGVHIYGEDNLLCKNMRNMGKINLHNKLLTPDICTPISTCTPETEQMSEFFGIFGENECLNVLYVCYVRDHEAFLLWRGAEV